MAVSFHEALGGTERGSPVCWIPLRYLAVLRGGVAETTLPRSVADVCCLGLEVAERNARGTPETLSRDFTVLYELY